PDYTVYHKGVKRDRSELLIAPRACSDLLKG
ncbi:hypothetical protein Q9233_006615, partial [Columba guinea]